MTQGSGKVSGHRAARAGGAMAAVYRTLATAPGGPLARDPSHGAAAWQMLLAEMPQSVHATARARWRGRVDALALRARYSDLKRYMRYEPVAGPGQMLYSMLEQNRVEVLGARRYAGVWSNLAALADERWIRARPEAVIRSAGPDWVETFALLARLPMGAPLPAAARDMLRRRWRSLMTGVEAHAVELLGSLINDQDAFARQSLQVIAAVLGPPQSAPRIQSSPHDSAEPESAGGQRADSAAVSAAEDRQRAPSAEVADDHEPPANGGRPSEAAALAPYRPFTTEFDSIVRASDLYDAATLARWRGELDRRVGNRYAKVARWAHRLQRKLLGLQMRSWQFDREEGELDVSRLTRVVTHPLESLLYKQESETEFPETVVTLLVDNSGSMRGLPIASATVCAELLGRVLERCSIKTEILGFTTRNWRGGRAYQQWIQAGRPSHPGRIAELRHIIYKSADEPWRRASVRMGAMLVDDLLKENVDGEALLWAQERLLRRSESRKILVVISDGAPLDDATLEANDRGYLERHLRSVIQRIELASGVELAAIGIGHDVNSYYRRAVTLRSVDDLGEAIVTQLIDLFDVPRQRRRRPAAGVHA